MNDVTLVVITYERPAWCEIALRSALNTAEAARADTRIVLLDNASPTDYAEALALAYGVDYVRMAQNSPAATPAAFAAADSTYAAILYDDDALMSRWLPLSLAIAEDGADVVSASYWETDADLRPARQVALLPATLSRLLSGHNPVNDGALVRTSVLDGVTWHPERDSVMLYSLWLELAAKGAAFGVVAEPCWYYRRHEAQQTAHLDERDAAWRAEAIAQWRVTA